MRENDGIAHSRSSARETRWIERSVLYPIFDTASPHSGVPKQLSRIRQRKIQPNNRLTTKLFSGSNPMDIRQTRITRLKSVVDRELWDKDLVYAF